MGGLSPWHWLILLAVVVVLFGPEAARRRPLAQLSRCGSSVEIRELPNDGKTGPSPPAASSASDAGAVRACRSPAGSRRGQNCRATPGRHWSKNLTGALAPTPTSAVPLDF